MSNEKISVALVGLVIGIIIAVLAVAGYSLYRQKPSGFPAPTLNKVLEFPSASPYPSQEKHQKNFIVTEPVDEASSSAKIIQVKGSFTPKSVIVVSTQNDDFLDTVGDDGNFSLKIELEEGENRLKITGYNLDGNVEEAERTVIYLP